MPSFWSELKNNIKPFFCLAPMDGVTDYPFRELMAEIAKPQVLFTEFTNVDALMGKAYEKTIHRLKFSENQRYIVAQLWGKVPENYYKAAKHLNELGFDGIDINMGCPVKTVMRLGSGASLINNRSLTNEIMHAVREGSSGLPVSIKTRIGVEKPITTDWISFVLEYKPNALTIHPRTAKELSKYPVHWEELNTVVSLKNTISPETVVIANGDILNMEKGNQVATDYNVDGIMIGRGIFKNPWLFNYNNISHTKEEYLNLLLRHTDLHTNFYNNSRKYSALKKYFTIYVKNYRGSTKLKELLMLTKTPQQLKDIINPLLKTQI